MKSRQIAFFRESLLKSNFISKMNLTFLKEIISHQENEGKKANNYYEIAFSGEKDRKVTFKLILEEFEMVTVSISREDCEGYYWLGDCSFSLSHWMNATKRPFRDSYRKLYLSEYEGSAEEKLKNLLVFLEVVFEDKELSAIVIGEKWRQYPNPIWEQLR